MTTTNKRIIVVCVLLGGFAALAHACGDTLEGGADSAFAPEFVSNPTGVIEPASSQNQTAPAGSRVPEDPTVQVLNRNGRPIAGQMVLFEILTGDGTVTTSSVVSDNAGLASVGWTLGSLLGEQELRASIPRRNPVQFIATATAAAAPPPAAVVATPDRHTFDALGQMMQIQAAATDAAGEPVDADVTWSSNNAAIASVDSAGMVRAEGVGQARVVVATESGLTDTVRIIVTQTIVTVTVTPQADTILVGATTGLTAAAVDANGYPVAGATYTWTTPHPATVAVDATGLVSGRAAGLASVTASTGERFASAQILVQQEAPPPPPPTGARILFHSDWATLGNSMAAILDQSKSMPWSYLVGNGRGDVVVPSTGLDFPTAHVYHSVAQPRTGGLLAQNPKLADGALPVPAIGERRSYRWYFRVTVPDAINPDGGSPHPIQDANAASITNWQFRFNIAQNGTYQVGFDFFQTAYPHNRFMLSTPLSKHRTYRFELQLIRTAATTFQAHVRIYDSAGSLLHDDADFVSGNGFGNETLADSPTLTLDPSVIDEFQVGSNGPSWHTVPASAFPFTLWYTGGVAVCADDWCGPWQAGEGS